MKKIAIIFIAIISILNIIFISERSGEALTGRCDNCHTMHNSQDGMPNTFINPITSNQYSAQPFLVKSDCLGCHANVNATGPIYTISGSDIPQVFHSGSEDLAAGNFYHLLSGENRGHNILDFGSMDSRYAGQPHPGAYRVDYLIGHEAMFTGEDFTCAGSRGCHGKRDGGWTPQRPTSNLYAFKGVHHKNSSAGNRLTVANETYNSYRFLYGVKGYENNGQVNSATKWQNKDPNNHNEYYGTDTPPMYEALGDCDSCHLGGTGPVVPPQNTISAFCGTCHGNFHTLTGTDPFFESEGIGGSSSPFKRHPTDIKIPATGEYSISNRVGYDVNSPVARNTVYASMSGAVTNNDVVMCLSCHGAHATPYPSMLKWDYTTMLAGGSIPNPKGCFACHTQK